MIVSVKKTRAMTEIEKRWNKPIEEVLQEVYATHGNQAAAAADLGISQPTFSLWVKMFRLQSSKALTGPQGKAS